MARHTGYILTFAVLLAAGVVGVVVMPAAGTWDIGGGDGAAWPWLRAPAPALAETV